MTANIQWIEQINSQTAIRKGIIEGKIVNVPYSQPPKIELNFVQEIYYLYPLLTQINSKVPEILGKHFHIDRLTHLLKQNEKHWRYMFDWNPINDDENYYTHSYNTKGSYDSFKQEINSQAFGQLRNGLTFQKLPLREIEIAFNILESSLKIAKDNDGKLAYNFVGKSFDLTEDVIVNYVEIQNFISEKLNKFISELESNYHIRLETPEGIEFTTDRTRIL
jgi:hypothetical protein